ncbi:MAG: DUF2780 domain-containing protein [Lentisphaerae bacterium]|jgi:hypothetical protein|nr:DUF2780 domain-containing protein [Lentisphaerota bacterium]
MNELIGALVSQLGIQESQAKGGAGLIFKLAREKLGGDFSKISGALPGVADLIAAAPQAGGAAKLVGGLLGALGGDKAKGLAGLASLAGGFSQLKLDSGMVAKFVPIILEVVKGQGGQGVADVLAKVLK